MSYEDKSVLFIYILQLYRQIRRKSCLMDASNYHRRIVLKKNAINYNESNFCLPAHMPACKPKSDLKVYN